MNFERIPSSVLFWFDLFVFLFFYNTSLIYLGLHYFALVTVTALFAICSFNVTKVHASVETSHNWKIIAKTLNFYG